MPRLWKQSFYPEKESEMRMKNLDRCSGSRQREEGKLIYSDLKTFWDSFKIVFPTLMTSSFFFSSSFIEIQLTYNTE